MKTRVVPSDHPHRMSRGDPMGEKILLSNTGKTTVYIVPPPPKSKEEIDRVIADLYKIGWRVWNKLSVEDQIRLNEQYGPKGVTPS